MEIKRCEKGHFYDAEVNSFCPQCAAERQAGGAPVHMQVQKPAEDYGPTQPHGAVLGETQPVPGGNGFSGGFNGSTNAGDVYEGETHAAIVSGISGFSPVVGWLVCIDGPDRGSDYRIRAGYNYIGRSESMDICIKGDLKISRERHATLAYDQEEKVFFFGPADGKNIVRINDKMIMNPQEIHPKDILTIGTTKLLFVPLCGEEFNWNE